MAVVVLAGCGGDAALSQQEAETRAQQAAATAEQNGTVATQVDNAMTPDADGAMGNAGGVAPGIRRVDVDYEHPRATRNGDTWTVAYDMRRAPLGLQLCVTVTAERSSVAVKRAC
jgi:hypothetical protein